MKHNNSSHPSYCSNTQCPSRAHGTASGLVATFLALVLFSLSGNALGQPQSGQYEESCLGVLSLSRGESRTTATSGEFHQNQENFCREFHDAKTSGRDIYFSGNYKLLGVSSAIAEKHIESLATRYCKDDGTTRERESAYESYLQNIPGLAFDAYKACLKSANNQGVIFRHQTASFHPHEFSLNILFRAEGREGAKLAFTPSRGVNCQWEQDGETVKRKTIVMKHGTQASVRCTRNQWNAESTVILYQTNGDAQVKITWQPYDEDDKPVYRMREIQTAIKSLEADLKTGLSSLRENGAVPGGTIAAFLTTNCPNHWAPADGTDGRPDLSGRFLVGSGPSGQDENLIFGIGQMGGAHQMRVAVKENDFACCKGDHGIMGVSVEWRGEHKHRVEGSTDRRTWKESEWKNHFPPYAAVQFCVKD